ncbi:MAG: hypothetical protein QOH86_176 [Sphingomonadales bacterium]|jgi:hypothetical protein|nr:hypothetical protein [Sphingomonadales bacterium]
MIGALLLAALGSGAHPAPPPVTQTLLFDAFMTLCYDRLASPDGLGEAAARAGFVAVPVEPPVAEDRETAAWTKGAIRLFMTSGQKDPR